MKKRLLLIGGGVIATHYKVGLERSPHYRLVALTDINPDCAARKLLDVPFFTDLHEALTVGVDVAMISTSTSSHYAIARELLEKGIDVICEKPMCESYGKIAELYSLADKSGARLNCMFHWMYADEVIYLKQHLHELGHIERITVHIFDDYANTPDGSIDTSRRGLCGAWLDSGINVLSYISELIDVGDYKLQREDHVLDEMTGQEKYAHRCYRFGNTVADISVDWRTASRDKYAEITCERGVVQVNHSLQTVSLNGKVIYTKPTPDRLTSHYENAFVGFNPDKEQTKRTLLLHKILFERGAQ